MRRIIALFLTIAAASSSQADVQLVPAFPNLSFVEPVDFQNAGDGSDRIFVVEQRGRIHVFPNDNDVTTTTLFLNIEGRVNDSGFEEGLLGLAFHPEYPDTPYFYVHYTASGPRRSVIERYTVTSNPDSADAGSDSTLLEVNQPYNNHNAGQLAFGNDGMLYIGMGDGGLGGDPDDNGQDPKTLLGSMLRIDVNSADSGLAYSIPTDNPFHDNAMDYREEIWAYGLRNPWRFAFDRHTGWLWVGDVGQNAWEEVSIIEKGLNYGWNILEGSHCYPSPPCDSTGLELPVWEYIHPGGAQRSITGGYVYRGTVLQELAGKFVYGDYITGEIWALEYDGVNPPVNTPLLDTALSISSFGVDESENLFLCNYFAGNLWRFVPVVTGVPDAQPRIARGRLTQNVPNPFNPETTIEFTIDTGGFVEVDIFDVQGRAVANLTRQAYEAGTYQTTWRAAAGTSSGVYFYRLSLDGEALDTRRMLLLK